MGDEAPRFTVLPAAFRRRAAGVYRDDPAGKLRLLCLWQGGSLAGLVELKLDGELREQTLDALSQSIGKVHSESWSYRGALSYFPEE